MKKYALFAAVVTLVAGILNAATTVALQTSNRTESTIDVKIIPTFDDATTHVNMTEITPATAVAGTKDMWRVSLAPNLSIEVMVQGCSGDLCFMPETFTFTWRGDAFVDAATADAVTTPAAEEPATFTVVKSRGGFMDADAFLAFLDEAEGKTEAKGFFGDPMAFFKKNGLWVTLLLVLLGGVLLNFTPCVLPMMPINLAIIGAGAGTSKRGFALGSAYGAGMVIVYGGLGWLVLRFGLFFGAIQSSPWFNAVIAIVFVALGLALLDVFTIDFGRLMPNRGGAGARRSGAWVAFGAGALSALLAGACVAPVVIAVLLLAGSLVAAGYSGAQFLPFVLGLGMALPWPFAGAGLSFMPNPGMWMMRVKQVFAVFVLLMACYYGYVSGKGFLYAPDALAPEGSVSAANPAAWQERLARARTTGKPVFVDLWATWCKNCSAMEATTFRNAEVKARLSAYEVIKVQAEQPDEMHTKKLLERLEAKGLPTFTIIKP